VHGVFASPNRRCRDSVAPLAAQCGVEVQQIRGFEVPAPSGDDARDALKTAYQAGSTYAELQRIAAGKPDGRFVICSVGGDIITSLVAFVAGMNGSAVWADLSTPDQVRAQVPVLAPERRAVPCKPELSHAFAFGSNRACRI